VESVPDAGIDPAAIAARLAPYEAEIAVHGGIGALGPVSRFSGRLLVLAGRAEEGERLLRHAVATSARLGVRPSLARASLHLASALLGRGDRDGGLAAAREAVAVAEEVGMRRVLAAARRLRDGAG
jgi:hypothetical protein